jgi:hypothetical protein
MEIHSDAVSRGSNNREIDTSTPHRTAQSLVERLLEISTSKTKLSCAQFCSKPSRNRIKVRQGAIEGKSLLHFSSIFCFFRSFAF